MKQILQTFKTFTDVNCFSWGHQLIEHLQELVCGLLLSEFRMSDSFPPPI